MTSSVKLKLELSIEQQQLFDTFLFSNQLFRNHAIEFLRERHTQKKAWIQANHQSEEYLAWKKEVDIVSEEMKEFKKTYKTKEEQLEAAKLGLKPVYPENIHPLFDYPIAVLSKHLTDTLEQTNTWLMSNLHRFKEHGVVVPKRPPKAIYEFYYNLPETVKKSLRNIAINENIPLYLLQTPRTTLDQTIQKLEKTYNKAFKNIKEGKPAHKAGFPRFRKIKTHGSICIQLDPRNKEYVACWNNQQLFVPSLGVLKWRDRGYKLPEKCALLLTVRKSTTNKMYATFSGAPAYNEKRLEQKTRSMARTPVVSSSTSIKDFLDSHTSAYDINRQSGLPVVVSNQQQLGAVDNLGNSENKHYAVSIVDDIELKKIQAKIKRKEKHIKFLQARLARQDISRKQHKRKKKRNPNGLHRKGKHSARRTKNQLKINYDYEALNDLKSFYLLALAQRMVQGKRVVFLEDLDVQEMMQQEKSKDRSTKHHKNDKHSQHTSSFGKLIALIEQVCQKNDVLLIKCGRYDATSQTCHLCGYKWGKLGTDIRSIQCKGCDVVHDRDYNATMNIKFLALYRYLIDAEDTETNKSNKKRTKLKPGNKIKNKSTLPRIVNNQSLAERVNEEQVIACGVGVDEALASADAKSPHLSTIHNLSQIAHEDVMTYIQDSYPIDVVVKSLPKSRLKTQTEATCGKTYHATFSKNKA